MKDVDLDKYKLAWKKQETFHKETLSDEEIKAFMHSNSKNIGKLFKNGLRFDMVFKSLLALSFLGLVYLFVENDRVLIFNGFWIAVCFVTIIFQYKVYRNIPEEEVGHNNIRFKLNNLIDFYNRRYLKSLFIAALSGTMMFLGGIMYYAYFKYGEIRSFEWDDYLVFGGGIILSFVIGAWAQISQHNFQIKQLESCLKDIDQDTINEHRIKAYENRRNKNLILFGVSFVLGLLILLFFVAS